MSNKWLWLVLAAALMPAACSRRVPGPPPAAVPRIDRAALVQLVQDRRGKVVLVDFWATWCDPCRRLFPHTVELQRRLADRGLSVITVSLDGPQSESAVREFLAGQGAASANFMVRNGDTPQAFEEFEITDGIPHLKLYDRRGNFRGTISGAREAKIDRAVQQLLDET